MITSHLYAISCDQKSELSDMSISILSNIYYTYLFVNSADFTNCYLFSFTMAS